MELLSLIGGVFNSVGEIVDSFTATSLTKEEMRQKGENFREKTRQKGETGRCGMKCVTTLLITGMVGSTAVLVSRRHIANKTQMEEESNKNRIDAE